MSRWSYRPELDGLRSVAVYLVLLFHAEMAWARGGFIGVDLFFVLSGFLVSHVILAEVDEQGRFSLGGFYARRVRRLLPAAVVVVVVTALVQLLVASQTQRADMIGDGQSALLYLANWHFIADSQDYFAAATAGKSPFVHFWSLSIEEQFYIFFPMLLVGVFRFSRRPARTLLGVVVGLTAVSVVLQVWHARGDLTYAYYATDTRIYQLTAGVLLALATRTRAPGRGRRRRSRGSVSPSGVWGTVAAVLGLTGIAVLGSGLVEATPSSRGLLATVASVLTIGGLYLAPRSLPSRALALRVPRYLGQISYGTYLWHWPVILMMGALLDLRPLALALLAGALATGLAALSSEVVERPIRRSPGLARVRWPVVASGLAVSAVVAIGVVPAVLDSPRRPAVAAAATGATRGLAAAAGHARELDRPVPHGVDLLGARTDIPMRVHVCTEDDLTACRVADGDGLHLVLVGDSHAQMFQGAFEELARERGWTLSVSVIKGCAWQKGLQNEGSSPEDQEGCRVAREDFYDKVLPRLDADVVVAIGLSHEDAHWEQDLTAPGGPAGETLLQRQFRTAQETVSAVREAGARMVIVKSVMGTNGYDRGGWDPLDCLARADRLVDCVVVPPLEKPAVDGLYEALAATVDGVATVDLNPVICPGAPLCAPVIGHTVVWKDPDHVTGTFLEQHRNRIWRRIQKTGILD